MFKYSTISGPVAVAGLAFMLALGGCSSGSDAPQEPEVTTPEPTPDPEPTDLEKTQMAAMAAADAAKTASDGAAAAASGANAATMNHATRQTGEMARMYAMDADKYAKMAMAAYMDAKAASEAAAGATLASAAGAALADAKAAQMAAEDAAKMAGEKAMKATEAAKMELMIDGTMKSVGDSMVDAMAGPSSVSTGSGDDMKTAVTGLLPKKYQPMAKGGPIEGKHFVAATLDNPNTGVDETKATDAVKGQAYVQAAAARTFPIGKTLDSSDDMARLMLITGYAGKKMVKVFADGAATDGDFTGLVKDDGSIRHYAGTPDRTSDDHDVTLRSVGMFYEATTVAGATGAAANELDATDSIGEMAKAVEVFHVTGTGPTERPFG